LSCMQRDLVLLDEIIDACSRGVELTRGLDQAALEADEI